MDANPLHSFGADLVFGELFNAEGAEAAEEFEGEGPTPNTRNARELSHPGRAASLSS